MIVPRPTLKETLVKGTKTSDEKFTKEIFDEHGRLLWQRVAIGGPGPGQTVKEKQFDETGAMVKYNYSPGKTCAKRKTQGSDNSGGVLKSDNESPKELAKKGVRLGSEILPESSENETSPSLTGRCKRSQKSGGDKTPEASEDKPKTSSSGKPAAIIPKSARDFVTTVLRFIGEFEDTTIKSNRLREKYVLNEYRALTQMFLISQAGFLLAFMILGIVLFNVFALLFVVILYASR